MKEKINSKPNLFSLFTFYWLYDFLMNNYQKTLKLKDLFELPPKRSVKYVSENFEEIIKDKKVDLGKGLWKLIGREYIYSGIPKFISEILSLCNPYLFFQIINSLQEEDKTTAMIYTIILFFFKSVSIICDTNHRYKISKLADIVKSGLSSLIFKKYMKISTCNDNDSHNMMNVMHLDVFNIQILLRKSNDIWSSILTIIVAFLMIYKLLGISSLGQLIIILLLIPINYYVQNNSQKLQKIYREFTGKRLQIITEIINGIQLMKLFAYEKIFFKKVTLIRNQEIDKMKQYQLQNTYLQSIWQFVPYLISLLCFSGYSLLGNQISVGKSFAIFSLFTKITEPCFNLPGLIIKVKRVKDSIQNIENFLNKEEYKIPIIDKEMNHEIIIENASFTWESNKEHLKKISLEINKGELIAIVGQIGSGKSTLLLSILGETIQKNGLLKTSGRNFSYLPQKPWIDNKSIKDNILFGSEFNQEKFNSIIHSCALFHDLKQFQDGYETVIGEKGINLSGGQKVRVALARCVYQMDERDIFLLDDPLAAVDNGVGEHLLNQVIFGKLKDKTRIITTHHLHFLEKADKIIVLKDGMIEEQGSFQELISKHSSFQNLIKEISKNNQKEKIEEKNEEKIESSKKNEKKEFSKNSVLKDSTMYDYLSFNGFYKFLIFLLFIILEYSSNSISDWWLTKWSKDTEFKNYTLYYYISIYICLGLLKLSISLTTSYIGVNFVIETARALHETMLNRILYSKPIFFDDTPSGRIISVFSEDTHTVDSRLGSQLISLLHSIISIIISFCFMLYLSPTFLFIIIPILYLYYYLSSFVRGTIKEIMRIHSSTYHSPFSHFKSCMNGLHTIRAFHSQKKFIIENESLLHNHMRVLYSKTLTQEWFHLRVELVGVLITIASSFIGILFSNDSGQLRLLLSTCTSISTRLFAFVTRGAQTESGLLSAAMLLHFIQNTESEDYIGSNLPSNWPSNGELKMKNVFMKYKKDLPFVLKGIDFSVKPKEKIGIAGRTGAGKSSLIYSLFRLRDCEKGEILIDDIDISKLPVDFLRNNIGIIQQEPILLTGSLRDNLDPEHLLSDEQIWDALDHSSMKQKILTLNEKLDYPVGDNGKNFSRGERQLICLARVILKKPKLLIMDEATSAVDMKTDDFIQKSIRTNFKDSTVLTIAHRLQTITDSDRILLIDEGRVKDFDTVENIGKKYPQFEEFLQ